jgi:hypothetical protein
MNFMLGARMFNRIFRFMRAKAPQRRQGCCHIDISGASLEYREQLAHTLNAFLEQAGFLDVRAHFLATDTPISLDSAAIRPQLKAIPIEMHVSVHEHEKVFGGNDRVTSQAHVDPTGNLVHDGVSTAMRCEQEFFRRVNVMFGFDFDPSDLSKAPFYGEKTNHMTQAEKSAFATKVLSHWAICKTGNPWSKHSGELDLRTLKRLKTFHIPKIVYGTPADFVNRIAEDFEKEPRVYRTAYVTSDYQSGFKHAVLALRSHPKYGAHDYKDVLKALQVELYVIHDVPEDRQKKHTQLTAAERTLAVSADFSEMLMSVIAMEDRAYEYGHDEPCTPVGLIFVETSRPEL